jgi:hypothetical protein
MGVRWGLGLPTCLVQSRDNDRTCLLPPRSQSPPPMAPAQSPSTVCRRETARCSRDAARGGGCAAPLCLERTVEALETGCSPPGRSLPLVTRTPHASTRQRCRILPCAYRVPTVYLPWTYPPLCPYRPRYQPILASLRIITAPQNDEITSGKRTDWVWAWTGTAVLGWPCQTGAGVAMGL